MNSLSILCKFFVDSFPTNRSLIFMNLWSIQRQNQKLFKPCFTVYSL